MLHSTVILSRHLPIFHLLYTSASLFFRHSVLPYLRSPSAPFRMLLFFSCPTAFLFCSFAPLSLHPSVSRFIFYNSSPSIRLAAIASHVFVALRLLRLSACLPSVPSPLRLFTFLSFRLCVYLFHLLFVYLPLVLSIPQNNKLFAT